MIPAILTRRLENEIDEDFRARQDACRNEANRLGLNAPDKWGSNLFDEDTFESGILRQLDRWKVLIVFDFGDLADSRDDLADRLTMLDAAGVSVISVADKIDLRGLDAENQAALKAFKAWRGLPATSFAPVPEPARQATQAASTAPEWTPEEEAKVRAHLALHGHGKPADLGKLCGRHWKTAEAWLKYAAANPGLLPTEEDPE
jgi:hypothetical protein